MKLNHRNKNGELSFTSKVFGCLLGLLVVGAYMHFSRLNGVDGTFELLWTAFTTGRLTW